MTYVPETQDMFLSGQYKISQERVTAKTKGFINIPHEW